jgi:Fe-S cluster assembly protein SufB
MLEWRLKSLPPLAHDEEPEWANIKFPPIDYQNIIYYSAPKQKINPKNLDEIDPELIRTLKSWVFRWKNKKTNRWPWMR